ncbi:hypothetical protein P170DRAFT_23726 [Aspergillus steynii IBT 23096]|uniref:Uncharacterized protein n=1 Tax=Aspergillus steynii IBT 23096 TaxID=1392250 RepID=A0A2I2GP77_9EURO|nr:uncharacterized protein P170DRAFT_23726 [Aspergillus steynii IBT 23096]PLB54677.1 hypothetical protein P170DRAFT_23726 [Aspergillus steynii IBT 23096]
MKTFEKNQNRPAIHGLSSLSFKSNDDVWGPPSRTHVTFNRVFRGLYTLHSVLFCFFSILQFIVAEMIGGDFHVAIDKPSGYSVNQGWREENHRACPRRMFLAACTTAEVWSQLEIASKTKQTPVPSRSLSLSHEKGSRYFCASRVHGTR